MSNHEKNAGRDQLVAVPLYQIAHARSGDKGSSANIGVVAYSREGYGLLLQTLTAKRVQAFFKPLGVTEVTRYELPNLGAFNFVLKDVLAGGGSRSIRIDAQGKTLGQVLLEMEIEIPADLFQKCLRETAAKNAENTRNAENQ